MKKVSHTEKLATCANKRTTLLSSVPRKVTEELTRESILSLATLEVRNGFIPSTILQKMTKLSNVIWSWGRKMLFSKLILGNL